MFELIVALLIYLVLLLPVGKYFYHIMANKPTAADVVFDRVDGAIYRLGGVHPAQQMDWKQYAGALLATNGVMMLLGYLILRIQNLLFFNPNGVDSMGPDLSFNTIISFMTNTNLQHYAGETGLTYLSQMLVITFMMFVSAGSGYAACAAFIRGIMGHSKTSVGNFYVDLIRITTRILLPFSIVGGLLLVWQGVPQNLSGNIVVDTLEGTRQIIATGPAAALEIIKHLGTNGGGFLGANSATPIENPTVLTNLIEMYAMMLLPGACVIAFGKMARDGRRSRMEKASKDALVPHRTSLTGRCFGQEGRSIFLAMSLLFVLGLGLCFWAEWQGIWLRWDWISPWAAWRGRRCALALRSPRSSPQLRHPLPPVPSITCMIP